MNTNPLDQFVTVDGDKVKFAINPSKLRAALITAASLVTMSALALVSIVKFMAAKDFVSLWVLLQKEETIATLTQLASLLFFVWRVFTAVRKKGVEVEIVDSSKVAALTTQIAGPATAAPVEP